VRFVVRLLKFMNYLLKETMMLMMKKMAREPIAVVAAEDRSVRGPVDSRSWL
jgi:hypothetical protein